MKPEGGKLWRCSDLLSFTRSLTGIDATNSNGGPFGPPFQQRPQPLGYLPLLIERIMVNTIYLVNKWYGLFMPNKRKLFVR